MRDVLHVPVKHEHFLESFSALFEGLIIRLFTLLDGHFSLTRTLVVFKFAGSCTVLAWTDLMLRVSYGPSATVKLPINTLELANILEQFGAKLKGNFRLKLKIKVNLI